MSDASNSTTSASKPLTSAQAAAAAAKAIADTIRERGQLEHPKQIWYFVACTIFVGVVLNVLSVVWAFKRRRALIRQEKAPALSRNGTISLKRLPSAVLTATRIFVFRWRIPAVNMAVIEILLTAIYLMAVLIWEFVDTQNLTIKAYANRAGHIAASQFPLIVALSSRNSAIEVLTGVSHEKLRLMHRAVSRVMLLMVWIHFWTRITINAPAILEPPKWRRLGIVCGVLYTTIVTISIAPIRKRFHEFFFITHVVLVFTFLLFAYLHTSGAGFGYYIWPCWVIWGFDRICRWLRYIILSNFHAPNKNPAELELVNHDTIRITVRRWVPFGWRAGQHMFLALPTIGPIESHPFSIASLPEGDSEETEIIFVIRAREGFTRRLKEHVQDNNGICRAPVFLDGPYGAPPDITPYTTCIFIAGGSGVTYTMPRMRELINTVANQQACARRIIWVWVVRHYSHINWFSSELVKAVSSTPAGLELSIVIYVTSGDVSASQTLVDKDSNVFKSTQPQDIDVEKEGEYDEKASTDASASGVSVADLKGVVTVSGKPDFRKVLEDAATTSEGPISVDVSGPDSLVTTVRSVLSSSFASPMAVLKGAPTVQLNVESFTM